MKPIDQVLETAEKIRSMEIRGAGRIATAAAASLRDYALALAKEVQELDEYNKHMRQAADILLKTRPTAVSLSNAIRMAMKYQADDVPSAQKAIVANADRFIENSARALERIGSIGSRRIRDGDTVLTHCNSMAAISVISTAHKSGKRVRVIATESRPRYQGLTTIGMLDRLGIETDLIVDSAARSIMNEVDMVVVGADVITANGSLVNKIGTAQIALAAHESRTGFMVAAETYKFSPQTILGELVTIEERDSREVLPDISKYSHVHVRNPAFDVTPHQYIDTIFTEAGAIPPEMSYLIIRERLGWEMDWENYP
ncbi:MAG TPA: ribose 1,5-bisphosphate isomerase [Methanothrix sp.]|nr:ribose 1,5-bisphosphate isomerase [Methanothrix sp.]HPC89621.1 ribose 1,5-bisphosphate isomerase [Methanothrix sp.]HQE87392.1 ribose 1,5-bisphosphate isomerase [Methanothrix sp.]HQI67950.1 ribose 1,5-bisphosphate isomerase [Methanothrix sp.]HRS84819.1 ribose 1,5-bisphosphate isomerase [Methanothrix sp.]